MKKKGKYLYLLLAVGICILAAGVFFQYRTARAAECTVTQYGDDSGNQGQFYLIRNQGELMVIDGGWAANAEKVRSVIKKYGNHVSAWILTHPHPDHMGAFNEIWQNPGNIQIDEVYTIDMDGELYHELAREWDEIDVYDNFVKITEGDPRIHFLYTGDELTLCGLQMKVLHAYSEKTAEISKDLANDGSMMFKLTNQEESMLFCADVGSRMSSSILKEYKKELKCDYIQMGHHGNGGLNKKFYKKTKPKAAFFDAPEWLMHPEDPESTYTTPENAALMESLGAKIYDYSTAPNQITLK
ncbi:MAG: MBL fold metallo-hydrolase [Eubacteriales bacterium]|nr:MBL fold metallo-hydrolase [Eubacteriales bacterium]